MAFEGGPLNVIGITPSYLSQLATQTAQTGVQQGLGQVWQGAGGSFLGSAGQSLAGNLAGSAVNIAMNSVLGTQVAGPQGLSLTSGSNLLASTITPFVTSAVAGGINQTIQQSLQNAGPFGPALSTLGTQATNQITNSLTNSIFGNTGLGQGTAYKTFPGAGGAGEAQADYAGGKSYTLGPNGSDVVFSIQPANQGPQAFGLSTGEFFKNATSLPFNDFLDAANADLEVRENLIDSVKEADMKGELIEEDAAALTSFSETRQIFDAIQAKELSVDFVGNEESREQSAKIWEMVTDPGFEGLSGFSPSPSWTFITAPEDISWSTNNATQRVEMFGTNSPPVVSGTRGMRELTLGNALVEGFVRNVTIEGKVAALEKLLNYGLNGSDGYVSVPVYQVWANEKSYGGANAYFILKDVRVKETMRDLKGNATRAFVDVSLMQVPAYQVKSGRDQASETQAGVESILENEEVKAARQATATEAAQEQANRGVGTPVNPASGPTGPNSTGRGGQSGRDAVPAIDNEVPIPIR